MTKVHYRPEEGSPRTTTTLGHDFDDREPTDVTDAKVLAKLRGNRFFEVEEDLSAVSGNEGGLRAVHRGRGVYGVADGGVQLDQIGPMTKADADAFNALTDAEKAAFVDKPADPITPVVQQ